MKNQNFSVKSIATKKAEKTLTVKEAVEYGQTIIADYYWAYACQDTILMQKYARERAAFESSLIRDYGEDFACDYYNAINA